jgi:rod shape-determining protein MreD
MTTLRLSGWLVIITTLIIALILMVLPLPHWAVSFRPHWLLLVMIYWMIALPHRVGIIIAWINGLMLDSLQGTLMGENALCFAVIAYIAIKMHRQMRMVSLPFQSIIILILLLINQILLFWFQGLQNQLVSLEWFLGTTIVSALLWPWIFRVLTDCIKRYRLH